jgi:hypothetical protein
MEPSSLLGTGIFAHETGQRFLHILIRFADRGFRGLYDKCANDVTSTYYRTGLKRVSMWDDAVLQDDMEHVRCECADLSETYETCFKGYVQDRFRDRRRPQHATPSIGTFIRAYLQHLGEHACLVSGDFFGTRDEIARRLACMDAARLALYELVTSENVASVELASEVSCARSSMTAATRRHQEDLRSRTEIRPDDSASQIGGARATGYAEPLLREDDFEVMRGVEDAPPSPAPPPNAPSRGRAESRESRESASGNVADRSPSPVASHVSRMADSTVSRHDFSARGAAGAAYHASRAGSSVHVAPARPLVGRAVASSRDSSVSIGMKKVHSPRDQR